MLCLLETFQSCAASWSTLQVNKRGALTGGHHGDRGTRMEHLRAVRDMTAQVCATVSSVRVAWSVPTFLAAGINNMQLVCAWRRWYKA